jgi:hypothetical protein
VQHQQCFEGTRTVRSLLESDAGDEGDEVDGDLETPEWWVSEREHEPQQL